jgi:type IV secretion system protein VirB5
MNRSKRAAGVLIILAAFGPVESVRAQFAVIDIAAINQLIIEVQQLQQALQIAQATLNQAQQAYAAITGGRGMENLLNGIIRNYLPANWQQLLSGAGVLGADVAATITRNTILTPDLTANYSTDEMAVLKARRSAVALNEALARQELANVSQRFDSIQQLINAIPRAADEKGILDLQARIQAEQGMLENENSKLHVLYEAAQSQEQTARQRADEQAVKDIGNLRALPALGLN